MKALQGTATRRDVIKGTLKAGAYAAPVIAAGAIPFAVGAVTGPTGARLLINGANTATIAAGSSFTLTGSGYPPNSVVYRVIFGNGFFSSLAITADASGNISNTVNTATNLVLRAFPVGTTSFTVTTQATDPFVTGIATAGSPGFYASLTAQLNVPVGTLVPAAPTTNIREG